MKPAKLPKGAYNTDLLSATAKYRKKSMSFNSFNAGDKPTNKWNIVKANSWTGKPMFIINCGVCKTELLRYFDAENGAKLKPRTITHCGSIDTFYIGEEIAV